MKALRPVLTLVATLLFIGCGREPEAAPPTTSPAQVTPAASAPATEQGSASAAPPVSSLSPALQSSSQVVIAYIGGVSLRMYAGVRLDAAALPATPGAPPTPDKIVLTCLPDFDPQVAHHSSTIYFVQAAPGGPSVPRVSARLASYDQATKIATLQLDPLAVDATPATGLKISNNKENLRAVQIQPDAHPTPTVKGSVLAFPTRLDDGKVMLEARDMPGVTSSQAATLLIVNAQDEVVGFSTPADALRKEWKLQPMEGVSLASPRRVAALPHNQRVKVDVKSASYKMELSSGKLSLYLEPTDADRFRTQVTATMKRVNSKALNEGVPGESGYPKVGGEQQGLMPTRKDYYEMRVHLGPEAPRREMHWIIQLQSGSEATGTAYFSKPFLLTLTEEPRELGPANHGETIRYIASFHGVDTVEPALSPAQRARGAMVNRAGRPGTSAGPLQPDMPTSEPTALKKFDVPGKILSVTPVREGRELLVRVSSTPHWMRLSLERNDWLPLPEGDHSQALFTGNAEALYRADTSTGELTRYALADLKQEAQIKMPSGVPQAIVTGSIGTNAPLTITFSNDNIPLSLDPRTLRPVAGSIPLNPSRDSGTNNRGGRHFLAATGTGDQYFASTESMREWTFGKDFMADPAGFGGSPLSRTRGGVTRDFTWDTGPGFINGAGNLAKLTTDAATFYKGPLLNSPCWFQIHVTRDPAVTVVSVHSWFDLAPILAFKIPYWDQQAGHVTQRVHFNPYSMTFAIVGTPNTIEVLNFDRSRLKAPSKPALLNFPPLFAQRGGSVEYTPLIWGPPGSSLVIGNTPSPVEPLAGGGMKWSIPAREGLHRRLISFRLRAEGVQDILFQSNVTVYGNPVVTAVAGSLNPQTMSAPGENRWEPGRPALTLPTRCHFSPRLIKAISGSLDDYLLLHYGGGEVGLLSLKSGELVNTFRLPENAEIWGAGDSLIIHESASRAVHKRSLPDFKVVGRYDLPKDRKLISIGIPETPQGPVSLLLDRITDSATILTPQERFTVTQHAQTIQFIDKATMAPGRWADLVPDRVDPERSSPAILSSFRLDNVSRIPSSRDGTILSMLRGQIIISPTFTTCHTYSPGGRGVHQGGIASVTGDVGFHEGTLHIGPDAKSNLGSDATMSRCGKYVINVNRGDRTRTISSVDDPKVLFSMPTLPISEVAAPPNSFGLGSIVAMGDKNLIAVLSPNGGVVQLVHLDYAAHTRQLLPNTPIVTSRPSPVVIAGREFKYQIQVNNPGAVKGFEMREAIPGASLDARGNFILRTEPLTSGSVGHLIGINIVLQDGSIILHEFPVNVVPAGGANTPPQPPVPVVPNRQI